MISDYDFAIEIVVLGQAFVGKTKLLHRYIKKEYSEDNIPTIGNDYYKKLQIVKGKKVLIKFWDTAGQERFASLSKLILKNANSVILVYDITRKDTFYKIAVWHSIVKQNNDQNIRYMLIGNKSDLNDNREVSVAEATDFAVANEMLFFEVSAKSNQDNCVDEAINSLIEEQSMLMMNENKLRVSMVNGELVKVNNIRLSQVGEKKEKKGCCG